MSAADELRAEVERLRAESERRRRYLLATLQQENEVRRDLAELRAGIEVLVRDLDAARADGTIYTYGQVQDRLRALLAGSGEQPGEVVCLKGDPTGLDGWCVHIGYRHRSGTPDPRSQHRPAPEVPDSPDVRERARLERAIERLWVAAVEYARVYQPDSEHVLRDDRDLLLAVVGQGVTAEPVAVVERIHEDRPVITARVYAPESWEHLEPGTHLRAVVRSGEKEG